LLRLTPLPNQRWSWRRELNPRPSDYKSDALPAELRQPRSNRARIADEALELQEARLKAEHELCHRCGKCGGRFQTPGNNNLFFFNVLQRLSGKRPAWALKLTADLGANFRISFMDEY
jgi:hypothetical protein